MNTPYTFSLLNNSREYSPFPENSFSVTLSLNIDECSDDYNSSEISQVSYIQDDVNKVLISNNEQSQTDDLLVITETIKEQSENSSSTSISTTSYTVKSFSVAQSAIDTQLVLKKAKTATLESFLDNGFLKGIANMYKK
ncbi:hypothetical protein SS50377_21278 [Spironucleus salmonicida]|uniref:Uncharacterized protein n=1 Tax=Spironucleus salmonicida TaxID=348837 RepID=A0A9P8S244_9EUKA|nr:hypothetical protein SS50377_21278 [Spironucleus salmonicida]